MQKLLRNIMITSTLSFSILSMAGEQEYPPLPTEGFVSGRIAVQEDVTNGDAAFATLPEQHVVRQAVPIPVPQYAIYRGGDEHKLVFVIQVEKVNGKVTIGARPPEGGDVVIGTPQDFMLLGKTPNK